MFAERCEGEYGIENVERFAMMRIEDYTTIASRAAVYTAAILHCKMLVGKSQTLYVLHPLDAGCAFFPNALCCVNTHSLRKFRNLFGASVNGAPLKFVVE